MQSPTTQANFHRWLVHIALLATFWLSGLTGTLTKSGSAFGQAVSNAKMHGVVSDSTGALLPNAKVVATQIESGQVAYTVSSASGDFILPNLPVGSYTLNVTLPGFQTYSRTGIVLQVSNDLGIDILMALGSTDTVINVSATASQVQTEDNSITTVVDQARVVNLPLNGRNAANLILLSGGAAPAPTGNVVSSKTYGSVGVNAIGGAVSISVAGGQPNQVNFLLDGGDNNDPAYNTNLPFPFPDALQEFSVQTTGLAAQYGLHPSGTVNIVTKSGTNSLHGGVFEFLRNSYTNASNRVSGIVTPLKRNQYGAYLGGPIFQNKLFFFGGYQGTALRIANPATAVIPTAADLSGNWSPYFQALQANAAGRLCPFDISGSATAAQLTAARKLQGAGFALGAGTNQCTATIAPSVYSPVALNIAKLLPTGSTTNALGSVGFSVPYPQDENQWIGRLDQTISSRQSMFARFFMTNYSAQSLYAGNLLNTANAGLIDRDKTLTLGHNLTITSKLTNSLRLTGNRLAVQRGPAPDLPNLAALGSNITQPLAHSLYVNVTGAFFVACGQCPPYVKVTNSLQASDDVSYEKGKHFIQVGADYIRQGYNQKYFNSEDGQFSFTGGFSGYSLVDFLLGAPTTLTQANGGAAALEHFRQNYIGAYAQDTFRVGKGLVLNVGLRWEPWLPAFNQDNRGQTFSQANFNAGIQSQVFVNAPAGLLFVGDQGVGNSIITRKFGDFSPRLGFAFDPKGDGKQSIRGSYTLLFDEPSVVQTTQFFDSGVPYGGSQSFTFNNAAYQHNLDNPFQGVAGGNPFPTVYPPTPTVAFPLSGISPQVDPADLKKPYANQFNLSYQLQISAKWLLTASYLGTHTVHLLGSFPINYATYYPGVSTGVAGSCGTLTPLPAAGAACSTTSNNTQRLKLYQQSGGTGAGTRYAGFSSLSNYGMANYNGLIVTANHQVANNFTVLANYTYSKCLANLNFSGDATQGPQNPADLQSEYGPCNFDIKHNFTLSGVAISPMLRSHVLNLLLGGFQISPLFSYRTGTPFSVTPGTDVSLTGLGNDRANVVPGAQVYNHDFFRGNKTANYPQWFNPSAFAAATPGTFGNSRPFSLRGPGFANLDIAVSKFFTVREYARLELRGEAFNTLNHPNYLNPVGVSQLIPQVAALNSPTAGQITGTANDARTLQIAAKITF